ncbi:glycosyltransferase [Paraburkholderia sp. NMBU_R16]|uniref:glycosyltransferase family 4 protein n=1 Tax=Paraburkholderia sp. NMBU_R16 TaxID=2698676 RepID=UPI001565F674|nr:glycosyltransferase family 4 protein [Paraburkholderia sp. NMBU_R16]NRO98468.1 glycosyltransferase [Paraburkholderia sp. NMBU_R16]
MGGSESCVCYLSRALAQRGHIVHLLSHNDAPDFKMGCHCLHLPAHLNAMYFHEQRFDAVIIVNWPALAPTFSNELLPRGTPLIFWCHHNPDQKGLLEIEPEVARSLSATVFVSDYQKQRAQRRFPLADRSVFVIHNGLTPSFVELFESASALRAGKEHTDIVAYTSTPFRGLDQLIDVMEGVPSSIELRAFSSMAVYQGDDSPYLSLYARARRLPNVALIGSLAQPALAQALRETSFFVYPNTFTETFCIAALEALAAGMDVIVPDRGALPETCGSFATYVPHELLDSDPVQATAHFRRALLDRVEKKKADIARWADEKLRQASEVCTYFRWERRAVQWETLLASCVAS